MTSDPTSPYPPACCPKCGTPQTAGVVEGSLCPRCLLMAGMANIGVTQTNSGQKSSGPQNRWDPPQPSELAEDFPELDILELAGRGGMGAVYKVRQKELNRTAALKILPPEFADNPTFAVRFERESQALAKLNHSNVVQVYRSGKTGRYFYFLMEFVDGVNLREAIRAGSLQPHEALVIVPQICDALQYAHDKGVVHRDIKPENILLDKEGRVKVTDFGLAKIVDWVHDASLTGTQQVMGTAHYMAPEQVQETRNVDHRADIYSLGVVFYEMLTGQLPLGRFAQPSESGSIDQRLDHVVMRTLENEPDRRYQAASDVKLDIDAIGKPSPFAQTPSGGSSFTPAPPIKRELEHASRKVHTPALCLQVIGYVSLTLYALLILLVLLTVVVRIPSSRSVSAISTFQLLKPAAVANTLNGCLWPEINSSAARRVPGVPMLVAQEARPATNTRTIPGVNITVLMLFGIPILMHTIVSIMMIMAGRLMIQFESYGFVVVTCVLSMLPLNPLVFPFSFATSIWALAVLNNSSVQQAFEERKLEPIGRR